MDQYRGVTADDTPSGGGAYVRERGFGHEAFNFEPYRNEYYGYVQATGSGVNLQRLGGAPGDDQLGRVTVAWVATHPTEGGMRIVGWYPSATVFAEYQSPPSRRARRLPDGDSPGFLVRARNAMLLDRDERVFDVPRGTSTTAGMGQSNIWYPDRIAASPILKYIATGRPNKPKRRRGKKRLADVARRLRIEKAAMNAAAAWFAERGYDVKDVSMNRLGWDLEARLRRAHLLIEVKGTCLDAEDCVVEVTPNEYTKMTSPEHLCAYRLCVVTNCERVPTVAVFAWGVDSATWVTGDGEHKLQIDERVAARISVSVGRRD
jgi:hypothetical protein